jgi:hypothetical protein
LTTACSLGYIEVIIVVALPMSFQSNVLTMMALQIFEAIIITAVK